MLLGNVPMLEDEATQIQSKLANFLKYLQKNHALYFITEYEPVPEGYMDGLNPEDDSKRKAVDDEEKNGEEEGNDELGSKSSRRDHKKPKSS